MNTVYETDRESLAIREGSILLPRCLSLMVSLPLFESVSIWIEYAQKSRWIIRPDHSVCRRAPHASVIRVRCKCVIRQWLLPQLQATRRTLIPGGALSQRCSFRTCENHFTKSLRQAASEGSAVPLEFTFSTRPQPADPDSSSHLIWRVSSFHGRIHRIPECALF